jgi:N-acetylglucosaminyl-diphospho-decaprenol L-rhamnosyltransferase
MINELPDVAVILVNWNTRELTSACIEAIPAAIGTYQASIWVVDNASSDDSVAYIQQYYHHVRLIVNTENVGFAAANNQAIQASNSRYALLLNTDTIAQPGSIAALIDFADQHPQAGMVGPMLLNPDGSYQGSFAQQPTIMGELLSAAGIGTRVFGPWYPNASPQQAQHSQEAGYIQGACMLTRRSVIAKVGLMDEHYFMYSEEPDWCLRMVSAGWQVWYTPTARILHYGGQSTRQRRREMVVALYRSKVRFFAKHNGKRAAKLFCTLLLAILRGKYYMQKVQAFRQPDNVIGPAIHWSDLQSSL